MRILFEAKKVTQPNYLPQLKESVEVFEIGANRIYVGNLKYGIELADIPASLIRSFNGRKALKVIAMNSLVDSNLLIETVDLLLREGLIDIYPSKLIYEERYQSKLINQSSASKIFENDIAIRDFETKVRSESSITTWRADSYDGGRTKLSDRQRYSIEIQGNEEASISLYLSLAASGFSTLNLNIDREIQLDDLRSGIFDLHHVGMDMKELLVKFRRDRQLFKITTPPENQNTKRIDLLIYFGHATEKMIQSWMSDEIPHLIIESVGPNFIIGPLVLPGISPCLNCLSKSDTKILQNLKQISVFQRPALAALNWMVGYLTLIIGEYFDTKSSPLVGSAKVFDATNPNSTRDIKYPRHPACGCNWL